MVVLIVAIIIIFVLEYTKRIDTSQFLEDNLEYLEAFKEKDYDFLVMAKWGEEADPRVLFSVRLRNSFLITLGGIFLFMTNLTYINIVLALVAGFAFYKMQYINLRSHYKKHLTSIETELPYYLKSLEVLVQHYTVPVALSRSVEYAPEIFRVGLKDMIKRINAGDATIDPYVEFAKTYPVRDAMRMMRLLYRLGLGKQENKQETLLNFSKSVSSLQNKAREQKYKKRLKVMEDKTMIMLVVSGVGVMGITLIAMMMMFNI